MKLKISIALLGDDEKEKQLKWTLFECNDAGYAKYIVRYISGQLIDELMENVKSAGQA